MQVINSFEKATFVEQKSSHTYETNFCDDWCIGTVPHGGYVASVFLRVVELHFATTLQRQDQPDTITVHLEFLRRTFAGPGIFKVVDTKLGRQTSTVQVALLQGPEGSSLREHVSGYFTNTKISTESGPSFETQWTLHPAPPPKPTSFTKLLQTGSDGHWLIQQAVPFPKFRKATHKVKFYFPRRGQVVPGTIDQWVRLNTPDPDLPSPEQIVTSGSGSNQVAEVKERFTNSSIGFVCDMWPQILEKYLGNQNAGDPRPSAQPLSSSKPAKSYWYPTLLLNLDIKKSLPPTGVDWLFVRVRAKSIKNGRYDLEMVILDQNEDLVALSHHVAFVLPASRNLAGRGGGGEGAGKARENL